MHTAKFVYGVWNSVDEIICQCECGISRSAAIAAAVRGHFYGTEREILESNIYSPNMYVYRLMKDAFKKAANTASIDVPEKPHTPVYTL